MNRRPVPTRPHPKHDAIVALLSAGATVTEVVAKLRCDKTAVSRIRTGMGLPPRTRLKSLKEKWDGYVVPGEDGHILWTGPRNGRAPTIRHQEKLHSARAFAFTLRTGREPVGNTLPDCGNRDCVAPAHMQDQAERLEIRQDLRYIRGLPVRKGECVRGHDQAEHGRYDLYGNAYCCACNTTSKAAAAERAKENGS